MKQLIEDFYDAFAALDGERMVAHYHAEVTFEDPAFGILHGEHAKNMWRMLCQSQKGKDFRVSASDITFDRDTGSARWEAQYDYGKSGRRVHNIIQATFRFQDGKIIDHRDSFSAYRWARQALGLKGLLIGWTPFFRKGLQSQTARLLAKFEARS